MGFYSGAGCGRGLLAAVQPARAVLQVPRDKTVEDTARVGPWRTLWR
jgi:hypothetical protein